MPFDLTPYPHWQKLVETKPAYRKAWLEGTFPFPGAGGKTFESTQPSNKGIRRTCQKPANIPQKIVPPPKPQPTSGPGTELKKLLSKFGIKATENCQCNARAVEMDRRGIEWCRKNLDTIVGWLEEEAKRRHLPFSALAGKQLVKMAIRRAEKTERGNKKSLKQVSTAAVISVVMPTYNQSKYLREAIDSVLAQTFRDFELIVVDDGSTDETPKIIAYYADPRIRSVHKENGGAGSAINEGFRHATGKYETWVASDNRLYPNALAELVKTLDANPSVDYVYGNMDIATMGTGGRVIETHNLKTYVDQEWRPNKLRSHYFLGAAWLWRRELREKVGPFTTEVFEDYDFAIRAEEAGAKFLFLDKSLCWYRRHPDSLTEKLHKAGNEYEQHRSLINRARIRQFPKQAYFYWGGKTLPFLHYLTLVTFCKWNPDWKAILYRPTEVGPIAKWKTNHHQYEVEGRDYTPELAKLPVEQRSFDPKQVGINVSGLSEIHKSDLIRWHLLETVGGLWSDMDIIYFAPLSLPLVHDTYLCHNPVYGYSIGFMAATSPNAVFGFAFNEAKRAITAPSPQYEDAGAAILNHNRHKIEELDHSSGNGWLPLPNRVVFNIPMETVYAYDAEHIPEIYSPPRRLKWTPQSIGCHWYAGHPLAGKACNEITEDNWPKLNNVLGRAIQRAL